MSEHGESGWQRRLVISCLCATVAVAVSTVIVIVLASLDGALEQRSSRIDVAGYIFGFPLATGWLIVSTVFGGWSAVHQGRIALVPVFSIAVDAVLIFLVWEFWHRKTSKELNSDGTLGLNR
jgi:hypothetical protein